ncbi:macro domain-containing protein [Clostridium sp. E02]|uniref:macro domain-containing protein n=1 Tax=Clostridium sp. E02 TaxID=2487134 RepID=UPI000F5299E1|nr:macro domain-containing protein [Clostridium sp. E02]
MLNYYDGDIFTSDADIICHQVNCKGVFGRGIAGQVKKMFPEVEKTYKIITKQWQEQAGGNTFELLGKVSAQPVEKGDRWFLIANLFGQDDYGKDGVYTDYRALEKALNEILDFVEVRNKKEKVAIPYKIGCGYGGGDWKIVKSIIETIFQGYEGEVQIWKNETDES